MLIESEGILYRGPSLSQPTEVWHHTRKEWVRNCFLDPNGETNLGVEIDEERAENLKNGAGMAEHFMYYDTPPWLQRGASEPPDPVES